MPQSFLNKMFKANKTKKNEYTKRHLNLETLENREMLSASPIAAVDADSTMAPACIALADTNDCAVIIPASETAQSAPITAPDSGMQVQTESEPEALTATTKKLSTPKLNTPTVSGTTIKITWGSVASTSCYQIEYKRSTSSNWTTQTTYGTSLTLNNASVGQTYNFRVKAVSYGTYADSKYSSTKSIKIKTTKLSKPTISSLTMNDTTIRITWNNVTNASSYQLEYKKTGSSTWITKSVSGNALNLTNTASDTKYTFRVKAIGTGLYTDSSYSGSKSIKTPKLQLATPTLYTPTVSGTTIAISWSQVTNASSYQLEYKKSTSSKWTTKNVSGTTLNLTGTTQGATYNFRVKAIANGTTSTYSSTKNITVPVVYDDGSVSVQSLYTIKVPSTSAKQGSKEWNRIKWVGTASTFKVMISNKNKSNGTMTVTLKEGSKNIGVSSYVAYEKNANYTVSNGILTIKFKMCDAGTHTFLNGIVGTYPDLYVTLVINTRTNAASYEMSPSFGKTTTTLVN